MIKVTHFYREQRPTGWSIEGIFQSVKQEVVGKVDITDFYCQKGLSRIQNVILAAKSVNDINHITGDVNFLAFGLRKSGKTILTIHDLGHYDTLKKEGYTVEQLRDIGRIAAVVTSVARVLSS